MTVSPLKSAICVGVVLTAFYTMLMAGADALTKQFANFYSAPQMFALSGVMVALFCVAADRVRPNAKRGMRTKCPGAMAVRSVATVAGTVAFFYAFHLLHFAEVFLFIALIPLLAAMMSGPVLNDRVGWQTWIALTLGVFGVACLFYQGFGAITYGHLIAFAAAILGTISMVASRYIGLRDDNLLAQVFYPNLSLGIISAAVLPFVFQPMSLLHVGWVIAYATLLFFARWVLVAALRLLPTYVVTPLMNLQFLWMVAIGIVVFGERPGVEVYTGAAIMCLAGAWLVWEEARLKSQTAPVPAE